MRTLALLLLLAATPLAAQTFDNRRLVSVQGEAETWVVPDKATITIGVETDGRDAVAVKNENDARIKRIIGDLQRRGVESRDIQTSALTLEPVYDWKPEGRREFIKFVMRNTVTVTVRNLDRLDAILTASVDGGSNIVNNVDFGTTRLTALRDSLRLEAARNARTKADALVGAVGGKLGRVVTIAEDANYQPPVMYRAMAMKEADNGGATVNGGQVQVRSTVSASFEIE